MNLADLCLRPPGQIDFYQGRAKRFLTSTPCKKLIISSNMGAMYQTKVFVELVRNNADKIISIGLKVSDLKTK